MPFFHNLIVYASKSTNSNKFKISANYNNNSNNAFYAIICNTLPAGWAFPVIVPVSRLYIGTEMGLTNRTSIAPQSTAA